MKTATGYYNAIHERAPAPLQAWMEANKQQLLIGMRQEMGTHGQPQPYMGYGWKEGEPPKRGAMDFTVNDVLAASFGRGGEKLFVVVATHIMGRHGRPMVLAANLSGSKDPLWLFDPERGYQLRKTRYPGPIFYTKQAKKRYDTYVQELMTWGNADKILPFASTAKKPEEPEPPPPESDAPPHTITIHHSPERGTVAEGHEPTRENFAVLKRFGFTIAREDGEKIVRRIRSVGQAVPSVNLHQLKSMLNKAGHSVELDIQRAETAEERAAAAEAGEAYLRQRAEGKLARAERLRQEAMSRLGASQDLHERALGERKIPGFFPTPKTVGERVIAAAEIQPGDLVLEPSAGYGAMADLVPDGALLDVGELNHSLARELEDKGYNVVSRDFTEYKMRPMYDVVIMNPPFEKGQDAQHIMHAYKLLKPGGRLVAIMSEGPWFRQNRRDQAFRDWVNLKAYHDEKIPPMRFGRATVPTRLLVIDKAKDDFEAFSATEIGAAGAVHAHSRTPVERQRRGVPQSASGDKLLDMARDAVKATAVDERGWGTSKTEVEAARNAQLALQAVQEANKLERQARQTLSGGATREASRRVHGSIKQKRGGSRASQTRNEWLQELIALFRRIKKPTGAKKTARGYYTDKSIDYYALWWADGKPYVLYVYVQVQDDGQIGWKLVTNKHDAWKTRVAEGIVPAGSSPETVFNTLVHAINEVRNAADR